MANIVTDQPCGSVYLLSPCTDGLTSSFSLEMSVGGVDVCVVKVGRGFLDDLVYERARRCGSVVDDE